MSLTLGTILFLITLFLFFIVAVIVLIVVAGKDIVMAFKRRFITRGCDVFIFDKDRRVEHYYLIPKKDGIFKIGGLPYVINPYKTLTITDVARARVNIFLKKSIDNAKKRINHLLTEKEMLLKKKEKTKQDELKEMIDSQIEIINTQLKSILEQLSKKEQVYFKERRPLYVYIKGDPIPKNLFDHMSPHDSQLIDNMINNALNTPPNKREERTMMIMKWVLYGSLIAAGIAAFLALRNQSMLKEMCQHFNLACKI